MLQLSGFAEIEPVDRGGFATVYRAIHLGSGLEVGLKVLERLGPVEEARFRREYESLQRLSRHPNVVQVYDLIETDDGSLCLILEYLGGGSALDLVERSPDGVDPGDVAWVAARVLEGLGAAHSQGIRHRDIKPSNVLFGNGDVKLADFGIAKLEDSPNTTNAALAATVVYTAPEVLMGAKANESSDMFSAGALVHTLVTGQLFHPTVGAALAWAARSSPEPERPYGDLPPGMAAWLSKALDHEPANRFVNAVEAKQALIPLLPDELSASVATRIQAQAARRLPAEFARRRDISTNEANPDPLATDVISARGEPTAEVGMPPPLVTAGTHSDYSGPPTMSFEAVEAAIETGDAGNGPPSFSPPLGPPNTQSKANDGGTVRPKVVVGEGLSKLYRHPALLLPLAALALFGLAIFLLNQQGATDTKADSENDETVSAAEIEAEPPEGSIELPDVGGMTEADALATLRDLGFLVSIDRANSETVAAGNVISSEPVGGGFADPSDTIMIVVSDGPSKVPVPDLGGMTEVEAIEALTQLNLTHEVEYEDVDYGAENDGQVVDHFPTVNFEAEPGSNVLLTVAQAPRACNITTVSVSPPELTFIPPHTRGDTDYHNNGPNFDTRVKAIVASEGVRGELFVFAEETFHDWTTAEGTKEFPIFTAPAGWQARSLSVNPEFSHSYVDTNDDPDSFDFDGQGLVSRLVAMGDTDGDDAGTTTGVTVTFNDFEVNLVELGDCVILGDDGQPIDTTDNLVDNSAGEEGSDSNGSSNDDSDDDDG